MKRYRKYFKQTLEVEYPDVSAILLAQIDEEFGRLKEDVNFASSSPNPVDRRLVFTAYFLAFIVTLDKRGETFERIRKISLQIVNDYVQPNTSIQKFIRKLPVFMLKSWAGSALVKMFERKVNMAGHPDGFLVRIVTNKDETYGLGYGVDIMECGICKLFNKHGYSKYAKILCEVDEITSGLAGLQLVREGTIANGATKCDFRWKVK